MSYRPERVCTGSSKNPTEYIREDIVQEMLEQQREKDADLADEALLNQHPGKTIREIILKQEKNNETHQ